MQNKRKSRYTDVSTITETRTINQSYQQRETLVEIQTRDSERSIAYWRTVCQNNGTCEVHICGIAVVSCSAYTTPVTEVLRLRDRPL